MLDGRHAQNDEQSVIGQLRDQLNAAQAYWDTRLRESDARLREAGAEMARLDAANRDLSARLEQESARLARVTRHLEQERLAVVQIREDGRAEGYQEGRRDALAGAQGRARHAAPRERHLRLVQGIALPVLAASWRGARHAAARKPALLAAGTAALAVSTAVMAPAPFTTPAVPPVTVITQAADPAPPGPVPSASPPPSVTAAAPASPDAGTPASPDPAASADPASPSPPDSSGTCVSASVSAGPVQAGVSAAFPLLPTAPLPQVTADAAGGRPARGADAAAAVMPGLQGLAGGS
jgi:hypothetical protein